MYGGKSALYTRAYGYYNPSALPALLSWLFLLAPAVVSLSLLSHYCWLCFLGLSVSGTYSFQHSRHLEFMQAGAPKLATEAPKELDCTGRGVSKAWGMVRGGWYLRKPALPCSSGVLPEARSLLYTALWWSSESVPF